MLRIQPVLMSLLVFVTLSLVALPAAAHAPLPLQVVAQFLSLADEQIEAIVVTRQTYEEAARPLVQEIAALGVALDELLATSDPNPAQVGVLVLSVREREAALAALRQQGNEQIRAVLTPEQLERVAQAAAARPLCQVIPALGAVGLF